MGGSSNVILIPQKLKPFTVINARGSSNVSAFYQEPSEDLPAEKTPVNLILGGAGVKVKLVRGDKPNTNVVQLFKGAGITSEVTVGPDQPVHLFGKGAGLELEIPKSIRHNIKPSSSGAGIKHKYYTQRTRFRDKIHSPHHKAEFESPKGTSSKRIEGGSKAAIPDSKASSLDGTVFVIVRGIENKITVRRSAKVESGIREVSGIRENVIVDIGKDQQVVFDMHGIGNQAFVPIELSPNVVATATGQKNQVLFKKPDGQSIVAYSSNPKDIKFTGGLNPDYDDQQNPRRKSGTFARKFDRKTLLIYIEGSDHDVVIKRSAGRGDFGAKIVKGRENEVTYNVRPDQSVLILNKSNGGIVFVEESIRDVVSVESIGNNNAVDYFK